MYPNVHSSSSIFIVSGISRPSLIVFCEVTMDNRQRSERSTPYILQATTLFLPPYPCNHLAQSIPLFQSYSLSLSVCPSICLSCTCGYVGVILLIPLYLPTYPYIFNLETFERVNLRIYLSTFLPNFPSVYLFTSVSSTSLSIYMTISLHLSISA